MTKAADKKRKAKKLSVKKETIKDLEVTPGSAKGVKGGGGTHKCLNSDACATAPDQQAAICRPALSKN